MKLTCPQVTLQAVMQDPVVLKADSVTYERAAIRQWLAANDTHVARHGGAACAARTSCLSGR